MLVDASIGVNTLVKLVKFVGNCFDCESFIDEVALRTIRVLGFANAHSDK
jgi:hypothetical protein